MSGSGWGAIRTLSSCVVWLHSNKSRRSSSLFQPQQQQLWHHTFPPPEARGHLDTLEAWTIYRPIRPLCRAALGRCFGCLCSCVVTTSKWACFSATGTQTQSFSQTFMMGNNVKSFVLVLTFLNVFFLPLEIVQKVLRQPFPSDFYAEERNLSEMQWFKSAKSSSECFTTLRLVWSAEAEFDGKDGKPTMDPTTTTIQHDLTQVNMKHETGANNKHLSYQS